MPHRRDDDYRFTLDDLFGWLLALFILGIGVQVFVEFIRPLLVWISLGALLLLGLWLWVRWWERRYW